MATKERISTGSFGRVGGKSVTFNERPLYGGNTPPHLKGKGIRTDKSSLDARSQIGGAEGGQHWSSSRMPRDKKFEGYSDVGTGVNSKWGVGATRSKGRPGLEDEYIQNLHQQVHLLELEMKMLKDKEIENKQSMGGMESLFRDGIPLNENFFALKNKYKKEREELESYSRGLNQKLAIIKVDNNNSSRQMELINVEYKELSDTYFQEGEKLDKDISILEGGVIDEQHRKDITKRELDNILKAISALKTENMNMNRTIEKSTMYHMDKESDLVKLDKNNKESLEYLNKKLLDTEYALSEKKMTISNPKYVKNIDEDNLKVVQILAALERDISITKGRINELENIRNLNLKYLEEEGMSKRNFQKKKDALQIELNKKSKVDEDQLKELTTQKQSENLRNLLGDTKVQQEVTNQLLELLQDTEKKGINLLDEKLNAQQELSELQDRIKEMEKEEINNKDTLIGLKNKIEILKIELEKLNRQLGRITKENEESKKINEEYQNGILNMKSKLESYMKKIKLNELLKGVDINDLKLLAQNNRQVNQGINTLISKWDLIDRSMPSTPTA